MNVHSVVMVGGLMTAGFTLDPGGGFLVGSGVRVGDSFFGMFEGRVVFPARAIEVGPTQFRVTSATGALAPCYRWQWLLGCAVLDVGMLLVTGSETAALSGPPVLATFGLAPRLGVDVPIAEQFAIRVFADVRVSPITSSFYFPKLGGRWQSGPVSGLFGLGIAFQ